MNSPRNTAYMAKLRNNKGFTMIEMAIVLVIIGIILGAVIKGQDLVEGAKAKQFISKIQAWQIALNTFYDRKGRFPGDANKDGIIKDSNAQDDINSASFVSAPEKTITIGGATFYVYLGNDGATSPKNYLIVCKNDACTTKYDPADSVDLTAVKFFEAFDTSIDGVADATANSVKGITAVTGTSPATAGVVAGVTFGSPAEDWLTGADKVALVYLLK